MSSPAPVRERIVASANELFARDGVRSTSLERVATHAGCSRQTVYRHFASKPALAGEVILRGVAAEAEGFDEIWETDASIADRLVRAFAWAVLAARENALMGRLIETEPDVILPALTTGGEAILTVTSALVAQRLRDDHLTEEAAGLIAELVVRLVVSLVLQPYGRLRLEGRDDLERFAREWIVPAVRLQPRVASQSRPG